MKIYPTQKAWSYRMQQIFWAPFNAWSITNYDPPRNACWYFLSAVFVGVLTALSPVFLASFLSGMLTVWSHILYILPWGEDPLMDWPIALYKMAESPITFLIPIFAALGFVLGLLSVAAAGLVSVCIFIQYALIPFIAWCDIVAPTKNLLKRISKTAPAQFLKKYLVDKPCQLCRNIDFEKGTLEKAGAEKLFSFIARDDLGNIIHTAGNIPWNDVEELEREFFYTTYTVVVKEVSNG